MCGVGGEGGGANVVMMGVGPLYFSPVEKRTASVQVPSHRNS